MVFIISETRNKNCIEFGVFLDWFTCVLEHMAGCLNPVFRYHFPAFYLSIFLCVYIVCIFLVNRMSFTLLHCVTFLLNQSTKFSRR